MNFVDGECCRYTELIMERINIEGGSRGLTTYVTVPHRWSKVFRVSGGESHSTVSSFELLLQPLYYVTGTVEFFVNADHEEEISKWQCH